MSIHRTVILRLLVGLVAAIGVAGGYIGSQRAYYYFNGTPKLCRAIEHGDLVEVQRLIRLGVSPSRAEDDGEAYCSPLEYAIIVRHLSIIRYLVEHGAGRYNPRTGDDLLNIAAGIGTPEILAYLMQRFPDHDKATLLYYAAGGNYASRYDAGWHIENVEYLLANGAQPSINKAIVNGQRALHVARTPEIAACLLAHGAQPNVRDNLGNTPLHHAAGIGNLPLVQLYLKQGLKVNDKTNDGKSVLWMAKYNRHPQVAAYLTAHGAR